MPIINRDRTMALRLVFPLITLTSPFVTAQVIFALASMAALTVEGGAEEFLWGVFAGVIPADRVFLATYTLAMACGIMAMLVAFITYALAGVRMWRHGRVNWFGIGLIGSMLPLFNLFPWVFLFIALVTLRRS